MEDNPLLQLEKNRLQKILIQEEEKTSKALAKSLNLPYLDLLFVPIRKEAMAILPREELEKGKMAIFQRKGMILRVAVKDPREPYFQKLKRDLEKQKFILEFYIVSLRSLGGAWSRYPKVTGGPKIKRGKIEISIEILNELENKINDFTSLKKEFEIYEKEAVSLILEVIMAGAIKFDASDVHFEPEENVVEIRYRIDGILHDMGSFHKQNYNLLLSRIKLLAGLKLNIHDVSQDGRFTISFKKRIIEIRASVLPGQWGESINLRVLDPLKLFDIKELGFRKDLLDIVLKEIKQPQGLIIVTGPTGSGKTTTLYSFLQRIKSPEIKIITIEDPIEYIMEGISQTQVNPRAGYDFAGGLKSILRQDPDIIMVGEMRDSETVATAIHAALTGHGVFSTLHTNDAAGAIPRLTELKAKPEIVAPAVSLIIAQRLVRKVCQECIDFRNLNSGEIKTFQKELKPIGKIMTIPEIKKGPKIPKAKGCLKCYGSGYKGRIGIFELFAVTREMEKLILTSPSITDLKEVLAQKGFINMRQDALLKVLQKITTLEEVERVIGSR